MFRRPIFMLGRPILRRPRLLGAAAVAGLGYALGRSSARAARTATFSGADAAPKPTGGPDPTFDPVERLGRLAALHDAGALTDEEFAAAKRTLLGL